jgi:hypothetical protein
MFAAISWVIFVGILLAIGYMMYCEVRDAPVIDDDPCFQFARRQFPADPDAIYPAGTVEHIYLCDHIAGSVDVKGDERKYIFRRLDNGHVVPLSDFDITQVDELVDELIERHAWKCDRWDEPDRRWVIDASNEQVVA